LNNKIYKEDYTLSFMKRRGLLDERGAAFELSITTMIVIVLAVVMLIMGLVLIRNIFGSATTSVDQLDDKVRSEINRIFTDESQKVATSLGTSKTAKIKKGTDNFGFFLIGNTIYGNPINDRTEMQYKLVLDESQKDSCVLKMGKPNVERMFLNNLDIWNDFTDVNIDKAEVRIALNIPEEAPLCSQVVLIDVRDRTSDVEGQLAGATSFTFEIIRKGILG